MQKGIILEAIAKEMQAGVLVLDKAGSALYANPFFLDAFPVKGGIEKRHISGITSNGALLKAVDGFLSAGRGAHAEHGPGSLDIEIGENGRFFNIRLVPLKENGDFSLLLFLQDITEEKRVETIKKDFVANVSHELRTPLASIKGYSETLLDGGIGDKETEKEFLRIIDRHATRMSRLIDDLLTLSKLESHQMTIESAPVDLKELIVSVAAGFEKQAKDKGIGISTDMPEGHLTALGDRDRLEQVIVNLLDNAIKYTSAGGSVGISARKADGVVRVDVADTGIGIPREEMPRIFERFYRVDKARSRDLGGTGLGLAIVKHIIQGHNGRVSVESFPGKGSTFSVTLKALL
ncbi:MAG: PAS domain-containing sensor histidine kinase [Deltaproteobacteria bacterium]|nr:PAS domain-containing sensor histidine kinase [Deltaproteobacteria bacterium]